MPVEFVAPKEGAIAFKTTIHIVKNSPNKELAAKLIEAALSPEVQAKLMDSPYLIVPTNTKVKMAGEIAKVLAKDHADMKKKFVFQDWKKINEQRSPWIEKFNRDIKTLSSTCHDDLPGSAARGWAARRSARRSWQRIDTRTYDLSWRCRWRCSSWCSSSRRCCILLYVSLHNDTADDAHGARRSTPSS